MRWTRRWPLYGFFADVGAGVILGMDFGAAVLGAASDLVAGADFGTALAVVLGATLAVMVGLAGAFGIVGGVTGTGVGAGAVGVALTAPAVMIVGSAAALRVGSAGSA